MLMEIVEKKYFGGIRKKHGNDDVMVNLKKAEKKFYDKWKAPISSQTLSQLQLKWGAMVKNTKTGDAGFCGKEKGSV